MAFARQYLKHVYTIWTHPVNKLPEVELELEFEIATLTYNIAKMKQMGAPTAALQSRLQYCQDQFHELKLADERKYGNSKK